MNRTPRTNLSITRRLIVVATLSGISLAGLVAAPAGAVPPGPGDLTTCVDVDIDGNPNCPSIPDPIDDFTNGEPDVDEPEDDNDGGGTDGGGTDGGGPSVDGSDTLPDAPVGDVVVANPTFTG